MSEPDKKTQRMWERGKVPSAPVLQRVNLWCADTGVTPNELEAKTGISRGFFNKQINQGYTSMSFDIADRLFVEMDCTGDWWNPDLREHYLNVNLNPETQAVYKKKQGRCLRPFCFGIRRKEDRFCCDDCREVALEDQRRRRKEIRERKKAA